MTTSSDTEQPPRREPLSRSVIRRVTAQQGMFGAELWWACALYAGAMCASDLSSALAVLQIVQFSIQRTDPGMSAAIRDFRESVVKGVEV